MIAFENIHEFITKYSANNCRVFDRTGTNRILDITEATPEDCIRELKRYGDMLKNYSRIRIKAGDDGAEKQNFQNAPVWDVYFPNGAATNLNTPQVSGESSNALINALVLNNKLQMQLDYDKRFSDLEKKLGKNKDDDWMKYAPLLGEFLGWDDEKMFKKLQMCQIAGNLNGYAQPGANNTTSKLSIEGTDAEKEKMLEKLVPDVFNKVDKTKFVQLMQAIDKNPGFVDQAHTFIQASGGLAGLQETKKETPQRSFTTIQINVDPEQDENF